MAHQSLLHNGKWGKGLGVQTCDIGCRDILPNAGGALTGRTSFAPCGTKNEKGKSVTKTVATRNDRIDGKR